MRDFVLPHQDACPFCRHTLDMVASGPSNPDAIPEPGDITVCIKCGGVLVFGPALKVRPPTAEELAEAQTMPDVVRIVHAIAQLNGAVR